MELNCLGTEDLRALRSLHCVLSESRCFPSMFSYCELVEVVQSFHGSPNDDGESNVLEGIQNLELLTDLRETS